MPVDKLFDLWEQHKTAVKIFVEENKLYISDATGITYSNNCNNLLRESAFCLIPAAPVSNYLDVDKSSNPSITIDEIGNWSVVIEGADTYSPVPEIKARRLKMERELYRNKGVLLIPDYLVNSGGAIFGAQERYIPTPEHLQIPQDYLGNKEKVEDWLDKNANEFQKVSNKRSEAGMKMRDEVIRHNIIQLINLLSQDANMLPSEAAEKISLSRIALIEKKRKSARLCVRSGQ